MDGFDDPELNELEETVEELFEENVYKNTSHSEMDERMAQSVQESKEIISRFVADEFITEAFMAATQLRNILGDADGHAAELAETIRLNLMVVSKAIKSDPGEFVLASIRGSSRDEQLTVLEKVLSKIKLYESLVSQGP